jgi:adenosylhomocysteine nucleosidase
MMRNRLMIFAAVRPEANAVVRASRAERDRAIRDGLVFRSDQAEIVITGMGPERAGRIAERMIAARSPESVLVIGLAGGLSPTLQTGDLLHPEVVIDGASGERFHPTGGLCFSRVGSLLTAHHVVSDPAEKAQLSTLHAAHAVDMETAAIARICHASAIPWDVVRVISDPHDVALPADFARLVRPDGTPDLLRSVCYCLTRPQHIPALIRLGRTTQQCGERLAERVMAWIDQFQKQSDR